MSLMEVSEPDFENQHKKKKKLIDIENGRKFLYG